MQKTNTGVWGTVVGTELAKEVRLRTATFMQRGVERIRASSVSKPVHSVKSLICPSYELCAWQKDSNGMIQGVEHTGSKCLIIHRMDPKLESSMVEGQSHCSCLPELSELALLCVPLHQRRASTNWSHFFRKVSLSVFFLSFQAFSPGSWRSY